GNPFRSGGPILSIGPVGHWSTGQQRAHADPPCWPATGSGAGTDQGSLLHTDQHGRRRGTIRAGALRISLVQRGGIGIRAAEGRDGDFITGTTVGTATRRTVDPADGDCARIALVSLVALLAFGPLRPGRPCGACRTVHALRPGWPGLTAGTLWSRFPFWTCGAHGASLSDGP